MRRFKVEKNDERELKIFSFTLPSFVLITASVILMAFWLMHAPTLFNFIGAVLFILLIIFGTHHLVELKKWAKLFDEAHPKEIHNDFSHNTDDQN